MTSAVAATAGERNKLIGLICSGHFYSHFGNLVLPPLFPVLKADLGVSYVALGALVAAPNIVTGIAQVPFGFLVDRFGGRPLLLFGVALMALAFLLIGGTDTYWQIMVLMALVGLGNSVFHPADFAILTKRVADSFIGRTVSIHSFSGYAGWAVAPAVMLGLAELVGWRFAISVIGAFGLAIVAAMLWFGDVLREPVTREQPASDRPSNLRQGMGVMASQPMLMLATFFLLTAAVTAAVSAFVVLGAIEIYGVDQMAGNTMLTAFLVAMAVGVLIGGVIADRTRRHNLVTGLTVAGFAVMLAVFALGVLPLIVVTVAIAFGGLLFGIATPSRDLLVRAATPPGSTGVAFGFTATGLGIGSAIGPMACGWIMDLGQPGWAFFMLAAVTALSIATVASTRPRQNHR